MHYAIPGLLCLIGVEKVHYYNLVRDQESWQLYLWTKRN